MRSHLEVWNCRVTYAGKIWKLDWHVFGNRWDIEIGQWESSFIQPAIWKFLFEFMHYLVYKKHTFLSLVSFKHIMGIALQDYWYYYCLFVWTRLDTNSKIDPRSFEFKKNKFGKPEVRSCSLQCLDFRDQNFENFCLRLFFLV